MRRTKNPRATWRRLIQQKINSGMSPHKARSTVARENPNLRRLMLAEANMRNEVDPDESDFLDDDPAEAFRELVEKKMEKGLNRQEATRKVAKENPDLHEKYLKSRNPGAFQRDQIRNRFRRL